MTVSARAGDPDDRSPELRVLVVADAGDDDPGWVGERLEQLGARLTVVHRDVLAATAMVAASQRVDLATPRDLAERADVLLLLGSAEAVYDNRRTGVVDAEQRLVRAAVASGGAVLGICYGAQLAASAFGAGVRGVERGEVGWFEVDSYDDALCPPGPWLQFHTDVLDLPDGARLLGSSAVGPQGFALDRGVRGPGGVVAWQFHPRSEERRVGKECRSRWSPDH